MIVGAYATIGCTHNISPSRPLTTPTTGANSKQSNDEPPALESSGNTETTYSDAILDDDESEDADTNERRAALPRKPHPLATYSDEELRELYAAHPESVGSISIGRPNSGRLINGVRPQDSTIYHLVDPTHAWGTTETVEALRHALQVVAEKHPGTRIVDIGHISAAEGGPLKPHHSHQSGRDVDLGLYYAQHGTRWYTLASSDALDLPRTWTLIRTLATDTDIEMILLDRKLQQAVEGYAQGIERDAELVHRLFHGDPAKPALVRHSPGHSTHLHLRFYNPLCRESARRLSPYLTPPPHSAPRENIADRYHTAGTGDTLAKLAQRYHTTMDAIRRANRMQTYQLVAGHHYLIPTSTSTPWTHQQETGLSNPKR